MCVCFSAWALVVQTLSALVSLGVDLFVYNCHIAWFTSNKIDWLIDTNRRKEKHSRQTYDHQLTVGKKLVPTMIKHKAAHAQHAGMSIDGCRRGQLGNVWKYSSLYRMRDLIYTASCRDSNGR